MQCSKQTGWYAGDYRTLITNIRVLRIDWDKKKKALWVSLHHLFRRFSHENHLQKSLQCLSIYMFWKSSFSITDLLESPTCKLLLNVENINAGLKFEMDCTDWLPVCVSYCALICLLNQGWTCQRQSRLFGRSRLIFHSADAQTRLLLSQQEKAINLNRTHDRLTSVALIHLLH